MNITGINQTSANNTNFNAAYKVQGVYINGKYFGQKHKQKLYDVSAALSNGLHKKTLSEEVLKLVYKYFHDYIKEPYMMVARSIDEIYDQKVDILSANDAYEYKHLCEVEKDPEIKNWTLAHIVDRNHRKKLILHATQDENGKLTITNIEKVSKANQ